MARQGCFAGRSRYLNLPVASSVSVGARLGPTRNHSDFLLEALRSTPSCEGIGAGKIDQLSPRELQVAERAAQGESNKQIADRLGLSEHTVKNYLFHVFEKLGVSNRFELLFLLFKECNAPATDRGGAPFGTEIGHPIETYLTSCRTGLRRGSIRRRDWHILRAIALKRMACSAYYWLRMAEASSNELGHRSRALVEQLRSTVKTDEIEAVERNVAFAVKNNRLFTHKRPAEFIRENADSPPLRRVI